MKLLDTAQVKEVSGGMIWQGRRRSNNVYTQGVMGFRFHNVNVPYGRKPTKAPPVFQSILADASRGFN